MKKFIVLWMGCIFCLCLIGCSAKSDIDSYASLQPAENIIDSTSSEAVKEQEFLADADLIEGNWNCVGMYYEDKLILFSEVPDLIDLYDQTLEFDSDGAYHIYDVPYGSKGTWIKSSQQAFSDFENTYLLSKQYTTMGKLENDSLTFTEKESSGTAIVCIQEDNPNYLVWLETDDEDVDIFLYKKDAKDDEIAITGEDVPSSKSSYAEAFSYSTGTFGQQNALKKAKSYLNSSAFSYDGLVDQLEYEGYSHSEAVYGADNCGADWNEQALRKAQSYLEHSAFSESGLIHQLEYEGFTSSQAEYGVSRCGTDWNEQAAAKAASYLRHSSFSRSDLIDQLEYEGFTYSQAVYGVERNGY